MFRMCRSVLTIFGLILLGASSSPAEPGFISGKVNDAQSGEELIGANVLIVGTTTGAATDLDGKYIIRNVAPGTYSVRVSLVGYASKVVTDAEVTPGQTLKLDVTLVPESYKFEEVIITAKKVLSSESALLSERKKIGRIADAVGAEQIKRTPDATSGDALKRVTGVSVVDNKFVFIRGVSDRYNQTTLDGASVASTESSKRGFSFDLVPSNLLENILVVKSATPDLPGDFTGGLVQINTLDFPDRRVAKATFASSYNNNTTGKEIFRSQGGRSDWYGVDDGVRSFPGVNGDLLSVGRSLPNTWDSRIQEAPYNGALSLAAGDRIDFGEDGAGSQLGYIGALSYRNSFQRSDKSSYDSYGGRFSSGTDDEYSVLWGALLNISYKFSGLHKISFKNSLDRSAKDVVRDFQQNDSLNGIQNQIRIINWNQRSIYTGQLSGEHSLPSLGDLSIHWQASVSSSARQDPDRKEVIYARALGTSNGYRAYSASKRSWSALNDRTGTFSNDFSLHFGGSKLKAGTFFELRNFNYGIRYFDVAPDPQSGIPDSLARLPIGQIYSPENYGRRKFLFSETSKPTDSYEADSKLYAAFAMADIPFDVAAERFRFTGGVRLENSEQNVVVPRTTQPEGQKDRAQLKRIDFLPSMNLTYIINDETNLRFALSHSVNRPEFREIAPLGFFDFIRYELVQGNTGIQRAYVRNYDVRFEFFPAVGEVFAVSYFSKIITSAIEERLEEASTRVRSWFNSDRARNFGWEIEARKTLGFMGSYLNNFLVSANWTRVQSAVEYTIVTGGSVDTRLVDATRPMQGQSSYTINASLQFTEPSIGTSVIILYNKFGPRLESVGFQGSDVYEQPRDLVDLTLSQSITQGFDAKLTIKNLTSRDVVLTRDGAPYETSSAGVTYSLQLAFSF